MKKWFLCMLVLAAFSDSARAVDFTEVLMDEETPACPLKNGWSTARHSASVAGPDCPKDDKLDLTLGDLAHFCLSATLPTENPQPTGDVKYKRSELARAVRRAKDYTPTAEEVTMMKLVIGIAMPPSVVGIAYRKIEPALVKK